MKDVTTNVCIWTEDENGPWTSDCGREFDIMDGKPSENLMRFCCYCGKALVEKEFVEAEP